MEQATYSRKQLGSVRALSYLLSIPEKELNSIADRTTEQLVANPPQPKKSGGFRQTFRVKSKLKHIQQRIVSNIFHQVQYPDYLQGSIKDRSNPRDALTDAAIHAGKRFILSEDIKSCFTSISSDHVFTMWKGLFNFSPDVAQVLTQLTTRDGWLYEGAPTSSYIANLVFWDTEHKLAKELSDSGFTYSRFVDDVTVSTNKQLNKEEKSLLIAKVYGMFLSKGCKPNRKKHKLFSGKNRATIHNYGVNSRSPTLTSDERSQIRAAVKECENAFSNGEGDSQAYLSLYRSTDGRVRRLKQLHSREGTRLSKRLLAVRPDGF